MEEHDKSLCGIISLDITTYKTTTKQLSDIIQGLFYNQIFYQVN